MGSRRLRQYRTWAIRCWGLSVVLLAAFVGPLVYCVGWGGWLEAGQQAGLWECVQAHPLQFPVTILVAGIASMIAGLVFRHRQREAERTEQLRERYRQHRLQQARSGDQPRGRGPQIMERDPEDVPDEIEVDTPLDLGEESDSEKGERRDSMMAFIDHQQQSRGLNRRRRDEEASKQQRRQRDYYVPPGLEHAPELYVDTDAPKVSVDDDARRVDNSELPHTDLGEALRQAFNLVMQRDEPVVVRLMPGVYGCDVELPGRVALVNHRIPTDATVDERLEWLRAQNDIDHPDRVTLFTPSDADCTVRAAPGDMQGLFGCYLVGRQGVAQTGLKSHQNAALAVVHCGFEEFRGGAVQVVGSGEDLPGRRVQFVGCLWRGNTAPDAGAGMVVRDSAVRVEASIFENNRACRGGAIYGRDLEDPLIVQRCLLQRNRAIEQQAHLDPNAAAVEQWVDAQGVGGAVMIHNGLMKMIDTIVEGNDARVAGGGIAAVQGRVVVESTGENRGVFLENRGAAAGALLAVGTPEEAAMIRLKSAEVVKNLAPCGGGGAAVIGNAVLQCKEALFERNFTRGDQGGDGGAIAAWRGGCLQIRGGDLIGNEAAGGGGAVAVRNGSVKIEKGCAIRENKATGGPGGGVLVVTARDPRLENLMGSPGFSLPLKLQLKGVHITRNTATGPGGGVRAGNLVDQPTFPLVVEVQRPDRIGDNDADSSRRHSQDIWIEWAGQMEASDAMVGTIEVGLK